MLFLQLISFRQTRNKVPNSMQGHLLQSLQPLSSSVLLCKTPAKTEKIKAPFRMTPFSFSP